MGYVKLNMLSLTWWVTDQDFVLYSSERRRGGHNRWGVDWVKMQRSVNVNLNMLRLTYVNIGPVPGQEEWKER
jgi:hypothetical protein